VDRCGVFSRSASDEASPDLVRFGIKQCRGIPILPVRQNRSGLFKRKRGHTHQHELSARTKVLVGTRLTLDAGFEGL
jgi:hypothetical protein